MSKSVTVVKKRHETRHGLHLFLTIITFGFWGVISWPIVWVWNRFGPRRREVHITHTAD